MSLDPRKLNSLSKAGKYTANANLIGITQRIFIKDSDAKVLIASGNYTRADVILSYEESTQILRKWNHNANDWEEFGSGKGAGTVRSFPTVKALEDAANLFLNGDSDGLKVKEQIYLIESSMGLVAWDSDLDEFVSVTGATKQDLDSDFHVFMAIDSDFRYRLRLNENIKFVAADSDLPTVAGRYIFRSTRPRDAALRNALIVHPSVMSADSEIVKGSLFSYNGAKWSVIFTYEENYGFVSADDITFVKIGDRRWSTLLQSNDAYTSVVATTADLTSTLRNESNGTVFVEAEQETYYWSAAHDQTINNGWSKFWPKNVDTIDDYRALAVGDRFTVRRYITGMPDVTSDVRHASYTATELSDSWETDPNTYKYADVVTSASNTDVTATWYDKGGYYADAGHVVIHATATSAYGNGYNLGQFFTGNGTGWVIAAGEATGKIRLDFTGGADAYPSFIRFHPNRDASSGFGVARINVKYGDGTYHSESFLPAQGSSNAVEWFNPNLESPVLNIHLHFGAENNVDGGCRFFAMGFPITKRKTSNVLPPGSYIKTGVNDSDYAITAPINISTGTRFIKSYTSETAMIQARATDQHFEGAVFRVTNNNRIRYYEYIVRDIDTPTNTLDDYNLISTSSKFLYNTTGDLTADQVNQKPDTWYIVGDSMYLYLGTATGSVNDYKVIGGTAQSDRDLLVRRKNTMFLAEDVTHHWDDLREAKNDGYLTAGPNATGLGPWSDAQIERADYFDIKIPANTAILSIRAIADRGSNWYLRYTDGNEEIVAENGFATEPAEVEPGIWGIDNCWHNSRYHKWLIYPVSKVNRERTIRLWRDKNDDSYISGLAFASENIWQLSTHNAVSLNRRKIDTWPTEISAQVGMPAVYRATELPWNSSNNGGSALAQINAGGTYHMWVTAVGGGDQILWFNVYKPSSDIWSAMANLKIRVNDTVLDSDIVYYKATNNTSMDDTYPRPHPGWDNPMQGFANSQDKTSFFAIRVPGRLFRIMLDSDGVAVPTPQLVTVTSGFSNDVNYIRKVGFMKYDLGEQYMQIVSGVGALIQNMAYDYYVIWNADASTTAFKQGQFVQYDGLTYVNRTGVNGPTTNPSIDPTNWVRVNYNITSFTGLSDLFGDSFANSTIGRANTYTLKGTTGTETTAGITLSWVPYGGTSKWLSIGTEYLIYADSYTDLNTNYPAAAWNNGLVAHAGNSNYTSDGTTWTLTTEADVSNLLSFNSDQDSWALSSSATDANIGTVASVYFDSAAAPENIYLHTKDGTSGTGTSLLGEWNKNGTPTVTTRSVTLPNGTTGSVLYNGGNVETAITIDIRGFLNNSKVVVVDFWGRWSSLEQWADLFGASYIAPSGLPTNKTQQISAGLIRYSNTNNRVEPHVDGANLTVVSSPDFTNWVRCRTIMNTLANQTKIYINDTLVLNATTVTSDLRTFWIGGLSAGETVRGSAVDVYGLSIWTDPSFDTVAKVSSTSFIEANRSYYNPPTQLFDETDVDKQYAMQKTKAETWTKVKVATKNGVNTALGQAGAQGKTASGDGAWVQTSAGYILHTDL